MFPRRGPDHIGRVELVEHTRTTFTRHAGMTDAPIEGMAYQSISSHLRADHEQLDLWLRNLVTAFKTGDRDAATEAYEKFERHLAEHLRLEEEVLFPELVLTDPKEVEALRGEHAAIRARVFELGIGVDLHQTRLPAIEELAITLRRHAAREDAMLYEWADRVFSNPEHWHARDTFFTHGRSPAPPVS